jgi:hypothetical protein
LQNFRLVHERKNETVKEIVLAERLDKAFCALTLKID